MTQPETRYTRAGDVEIAYQTYGDGPIDLVWAFGLMTHLEVKWEEPALAAMLDRLAEFSRLVLFDRRGCGLSDRGDRHLAPTLEERVEDVVAVLDAVGSTRASFFGVSEGCALAALFASMHPERTDRIVLYGGMSRIARDEDHPWGLMDPSDLATAYEPVIAHWGTEEGAAAHVRMVAPSLAEDPAYLAWFARQQRHALSRDAVARFLATVAEYDMDAVHPAIRVPTLVLHRAGDTVVPASCARRAASRIPGATLVELPGVDHLPYVGDAGAVVEATRRFLEGRPGAAPTDRQLLTLLAVDAPDAEARASVRRHVARWDGVEVNPRAGEVLARFGTATRALRCGLGVVEAATRRGLTARAAVHTGECEVGRDGVGGPATQVPAALLGVAGVGEVVASGTVRDLVPGSGIGFGEERRVRVAGLPGELVAITVGTPTAVEDSAATAAAQERPAPQVFRLDGEYWTVAFDGRVVTLRDTKGMHDLATLLADPGRERHVLDLWAGAGGGSSAPVAPADEVLDGPAREAYRRRLAELDARLEQDGGDLRAAEERERLVEELTAAYGLSGRGRRLTDEAERARKAVRRRVSDALGRLEAVHPSLGRHLRHAVHTGVFCSYDPERETRWETVGPATAPSASRVSHAVET